MVLREEFHLGFDPVRLSPAEEVQRVSKGIHAMGIGDD